MSMKKLLQTVACAATLSLLASGAQAQGELFLYNWSNYFPPDLLTKFEKDTGIKVTLDVYDSNETMLAKLQAGAAGYEVVVPSDSQKGRAACRERECHEVERSGCAV